MEGMEKQTAVDWLEEQLNERLHHLSNHKIHIKEFVRTAKSAEIRNILEIIQQAKEMEKEQIERAFEEGMFHHTNGLCPDEYYEETFKSE
jgi:hypothetical protein